MKVKIGDKIYNSEKQPIMIIMSKEEKDLISSMDGNDYRFCSYPENENPEKIKEFMNIQDKIYQAFGLTKEQVETKENAEMLSQYMRINHLGKD